jgi:hypothetical protein
VEALDKSFENVCELDLIFHSDRVHYILDEIIMAGMVLETNIHQILAAVNDQNKMHTASLTASVSGSSGILPPSANTSSNSGISVNSLTNHPNPNQYNDSSSSIFNVFMSSSKK